LQAAKISLIRFCLDFAITQAKMSNLEHSSGVYTLVNEQRSAKIWHLQQVIVEISAEPRVSKIIRRTKWLYNAHFQS